MSKRNNSDLSQTVHLDSYPSLHHSHKIQQTFRFSQDQSALKAFTKLATEEDTQQTLASYSFQMTVSKDKL